MKALFLNVFFLFFFCGIGHSQVFYKHNRDINYIYLDQNDKIYFIDDREAFFSWDNKSADLNPIKNDVSWLDHSNMNAKGVFYNHFQKGSGLETEPGQLVASKDIFDITFQSGEINLERDAKSMPCKISVDASQNTVGRYRIHKDEHFLLLGDRIMSVCEDKQFKLSQPAKDFCFIEEQILYVGDDGVMYIIDGEQGRQLYIPALNIPNGICRLEYQEGILWMHTCSQELYSLDYERQIMRNHGNAINDFVLDKWNVLWLAKGLELLSNDIYVNDESPILNLKKLLVNDLQEPFKNQFEIRQGDLIEIELDSYYNPDPDNIRIEYKWIDNQWHATGESLLLHCNKAGQFNLELRAVVNEGKSSSISRLDFYVKENVLLSYWKYVLIGFGALLLITILAWVRNIRLNRRSKRRMQEIQNKYALLASQQKYRQAQMNPHFIFNALNAIKGLSAIGQSEKVRRSLSYFAKIMRMQLETAEQESISLDEEQQYLENYLQFEKLIRGFDFEYTIDVEDMNVRVAPMMIQPFVENALIHGLSKSSGLGKLFIRIKEDKQYINVIIEDNGIGVNSAHTASKDHKSKAIDIFKQRCSQLDKWKLRQYYTLENITDGHGRITGARCTLYIPKM